MRKQMNYVIGVALIVDGIDAITNEHHF